MESAITDTIIRALQDLKVVTYDSIRWFDRTYSVDSYKKALWEMETKEQVRRRVFQTGKNERYVWILPWYEDDADEKIEELVQDIVAHLTISPATPGELRQYFREKHPAYHQISYLALKSAVRDGLILREEFNDGLPKTIYHLPDTDDLKNLESKVLQYVNEKGFAFAQDLSESLKITRSLAFPLLAKLAKDGKITRFKVTWNYARNVPIFAYCKEGYEAKAVARFRQIVHERLIQRKRDRLMEDYLSKFRAASARLKADESLPELAISYFEKLLRSDFRKGRNPEIVAWSAYFLASKILRQGITPGDIETQGNLRKALGKDLKGKVTEKELRKIRKRTLLLPTVKDANDFLELSAPDLYSRPIDYLGKIAGKMNLTEKLWTANGLTRREELLQETDKLISRFPKQVFFGKRSESLAGAALYMVASHLGVTECTQKRIADAADVTEVTIRNTIKKIVGSLQAKSDTDDLRWINELGSPNAVMKAKGLTGYKDKHGLKKRGTEKEVQELNIQDALARMFESTEEGNL